MNISNATSYTQLYTNTQTSAKVEGSGHPSGCSCPGCSCDETQSSNKSKDSTEIKSETGQKTVEELTPAESQQLASLQQRDTDVRAHEAAHIAAGGSAVKGGASFTYEKGPDGKLYAVGGEVPISLGGGDTPEEKIANAKAVQAGALAPASPSPQDLKVASSAAQIEAAARSELAEDRREELQEKAKTAYGENVPEEPEISNEYTPFDLSA